MNKALIITTTSGFLSQFELNNVRLLQKKGYQVHYATNFGVPIYEVKDETLRNMGVVLRVEADRGNEGISNGAGQRRESGIL